MIFTLPKRTRLLWQLRVLVAVATFCVVVIGLFGFTLRGLLPTTIVLSIGSAFIFGYIPVFCENYQILVDDTGLKITKGVFIKETLIIPRPRLAFVKSIATPTLNLLNLRLVMLKVSREWIVIPEMDKKDINRLLAVLYNEKKSV